MPLPAGHGSSLPCGIRFTQGTAEEIRLPCSTPSQAERVCDDGSNKNGEWHHIATISNRKSSARGGPWTPKFEGLFEQVGMSLNDSANLIHIQDHEGPHSEQYHETIHDRLLGALRQCTSMNECRQAFMDELAKIADELCTPGTTLNRMLIKKARP